MRKVLIDANLLIAAFDNHGTTSDENRVKAKAIIGELLLEENTVLFITPLIRYEVLRGVSYEDEERFTHLKDALTQLEELDIDRNISELAIKLFRQDRLQPESSDRNIDKRNFDVFHFACAKHEKLEWVSLDRDFTVMEQLYQTYEQQQAN